MVRDVAAHIEQPPQVQEKRLFRHRASPLPEAIGVKETS